MFPTVFVPSERTTFYESQNLSVAVSGCDQEYRAESRRANIRHQTNHQHQKNICSWKCKYL